MGRRETVDPVRVCVVGPGTHFLSGITYYTFGLCGALSTDVRVSAIFMRRLLPRLLYPGHARVGSSLSSVTVPEGVRTFDGVDWFWVPSIVRALRFLRKEGPDVVIFQWLSLIHI